MEIEAPPTQHGNGKPVRPRRGLLMINTGDGKGKTTAALGLAVRAQGRGKSVRFFQFMKVAAARFGEHRAFDVLGLKIEGLGDGFSWKSKDLEHSAQLARDGWARAEAAIRAGEHFLVVLDEITYPLNPKPFIWTKSARDILQKVIRANSRLSSKQNEALH